MRIVPPNFKTWIGYMKIFLSMSFLIFASALQAAPLPWAFCDGNKRAYKVDQQTVVNCPKSPGNPEVINPDLCTSRQISVTVNHPELDYICALTTASDTDNPEQVNTNRCINADKKHCVLDAGGIAGPGEHSIPGDAWYEQTGATALFPKMRCQCGCFVGETYISGISGYERIDSLAERAKAMPVGIQLFPWSKGTAISQPLRGSDFTVGPEENPVVRISTRTGVEIVVTELHPILVVRNDEMEMVQAKDLVNGDVLMDENGKKDAVSILESYRLDPNSNKVYNIDTRSDDPEEHVISANKIRVGDLYWQKRLSEETSRIENLLSAAQ